VDKTTATVPVLEVTPVPPEATGSVPVVKTEVLEAYTAPPDVNAVRPVPPLVVARVPARVIAPLVPVLGVNPVVPALKVVTAELERVCQDGKPPETVRI
jgi:hypothetical protein